jgi:hypothetical protein
MVLYLRCICLDLLLYMLLYTLLIIDWLLQWTQRVGTSFGQHWISSKKFQSHSTSSSTLSRTINSNSIIDLMIHFYLENFYDTIASSSVKIYPLVDFKSLVLNINWNHYIILVPLSNQYSVTHSPRVTLDIWLSFQFIFNNSYSKY